MQKIACLLLHLTVGFRRDEGARQKTRGSACGRRGWGSAPMPGHLGAHAGGRHPRLSQAKVARCFDIWRPPACRRISCICRVCPHPATSLESVPLKQPAAASHSSAVTQGATKASIRPPPDADRKPHTLKQGGEGSGCPHNPGHKPDPPIAVHQAGGGGRTIVGRGGSAQLQQVLGLLALELLRFQFARVRHRTKSCARKQPTFRQA